MRGSRKTGSGSLFMCDSEVEFYSRENALQISATFMRLDYLI